MGKRAKRKVSMEAHFITVDTYHTGGELTLTGQSYAAKFDSEIKLPIAAAYSLLNGLKKALEGHRKHIVELQNVMQRPPTDSL